MDSGRGRKPDHDRKSVENEHFKKRPRVPRTKKKEKANRVTEKKKCSTCQYWYSPEAFDRDARSALQPQCKECRDAWEGTAAGVHCRMMSWLDREEPEAAAEWRSQPGGSFAVFQRMWDEEGGCCHWCGAGLSEWQHRGIRLDRKDNNDGHRPQNVWLCCWPCNLRRGRMLLHAWKELIGASVREHGRGNVPHGAYDDRVKKRTGRRTAHLRVDAPQVELFEIPKKKRSA